METVKLSQKSIVHKKIVQEYYSKRNRDYDKQKMRTWKSETGFEDSLLDKMVDVASDVLQNGTCIFD